MGYRDKLREAASKGQNIDPMGQGKGQRHFAVVPATGVQMYVVDHEAEKGPKGDLPLTDEQSVGYLFNKQWMDPVLLAICEQLVKEEIMREVLVRHSSGNDVWYYKFECERQEQQGKRRKSDYSLDILPLLFVLPDDRKDLPSYGLAYGTTLVYDKNPKRKDAKGPEYQRGSFAAFLAVPLELYRRGWYTEKIVDGQVVKVPKLICIHSKNKATESLYAQIKLHSDYVNKARKVYAQQLASTANVSLAAATEEAIIKINMFTLPVRWGMTDAKVLHSNASGAGQQVYEMKNRTAYPDLSSPDVIDALNELYCGEELHEAVLSLLYNENMEPGGEVVEWAQEYANEMSKVDRKYTHLNLNWGRNPAPEEMIRREAGEPWKGEEGGVVVAEVDEDRDLAPFSNEIQRLEKARTLFQQKNSAQGVNRVNAVKRILDEYSQGKGPYSSESDLKRKLLSEIDALTAFYNGLRRS